MNRRKILVSILVFLFLFMIIKQSIQIRNLRTKITKLEEQVEKI